MKGSTSTVAVPLRCGRLLRSLPQLRSTATVEGEGRGRLDSRIRLVRKRTVNNKQQQIKEPLGNTPFGTTIHPFGQELLLAHGARDINMRRWESGSVSGKAVK